MANANTQFGGFLTNVGVVKQTNANALQIPWKITRMELGDAGGDPAQFPDPTPSPTQTALINVVYDAPLNALYPSPTDPGVLIAELVLPPNVGGWWIRETALRDEDGDLIAVAAPAPSYKPLIAQGSGRTQTIRMHVVVGNTANIQLRIDPSVVLATRQYVDLLTVRATQADAEAMEDEGKIMTPKRVLQALRSAVGQATDALRGVLRIATHDEVNDGESDYTAVTPKKLRWGFSVSLGTNGYIVFPGWLGGLIIQWVSVQTSTAATTSFTWPLAFTVFARGYATAHSSLAVFSNLNSVGLSGGSVDAWSVSGSRPQINVQILGIGK